MRGRSPAFVIAVVASLATVPVARAADCPQAEISSAASGLQDARNALISLPLAGDPNPALSPQTQSAIAEMKAKLAGFILAYMRCQPENADIDGIEVDLSRLGWARPFDAGRTDGNGNALAPADAPGWHLAFDTKPLGQGLIGIAAAFAIPCGRDTVLMIFGHSDEGWREIIRVAAPPYRDVRRAYGALDYAISPPDADGDWFLVEEHLPAMCSPANAGLSYSVLRPGPSALRPRVLLSGHDSLSSGEDDLGGLAVVADQFEIRLSENVRRFSVIGQTVTPEKNPAPR